MTQGARSRSDSVRRSARGIAACLGALLLSSCGIQGGPAAGGAAQPLTVLAAASLSEAFTQIGADFEAAHPGSRVRFGFGSSATLASQIVRGAPADVFAAASAATMTTVTDAGAAPAAVQFASNTLEIAVPRGNPGAVTGLHDFAVAEKRIALCDASVPCGAAAVKVFALARVTPKPDTLEQDVKATLQKVARNEVDAALVYRTDVIAAKGAVQGIDFPESARATNQYPIAVLAEARDPAAARGFVDYVRSPAGQAVLRKAGFAKP